MSHALFSPSSAYRWTRCPGSVVLSEGIEQDSEATKEGTYLHKVMQNHLEKLVPLNKCELTDEQHACCAECARHVKSLDHDDAFYELKVCFSDAVSQPDYECTGTADVVLARGDTLRVIDYKFGRNYVDPEDNQQGILYMLGALQTMAFAGYNFNKVEFEVLQPRVGENVSNGVFSLTAEELKAIGKTMAGYCVDVKDAIRNKDKREEMGWQSAFLRMTESGCKYCPAMHKCPAMMDVVGQSVCEVDTVREANNSRLAAQYATLPVLKEYIKAVEEEAMKRLMNQEELPGFFLAKGRLGNRVWRNEEEVRASMSNLGVKPDETVLLSPARLQDRVVKVLSLPKKEVKEIIDGLCERGEGKPTIASKKDGGEPWQPDEKIISAFKNLTN